MCRVPLLLKILPERRIILWVNLAPHFEASVLDNGSAPPPHLPLSTTNSLESISAR
jgi:hypothetical protein